MSRAALKRVFYVNVFGQPAFAEALARHADIELVGLSDGSTEAQTAAVLGSSHVYHISSGVNDMAPRFLADEALLARAPHLLAVSTIGAGYDTVDVPACTRAGVLVVNQSGGGNAQAVAEHMLAMMLVLSKRILEADRHMRREPGIVRGDYVGHNVQGKTVGIVGFGNVGKRLAQSCRAAFGMRVLVHDSHRIPGDVHAHGAEPVSLEALLRQSDFVAVCCSLTPQTRGMIGAREFALMPAHAFFVNAARGGIHDEAALAAALRERRIAGAGIDVWDVEPPAPEHPLLAFDTVVATPHTAGATVESRVEAAQRAAQQIVDLLAGRRPPRLLNAQAWPLFAERHARLFGSPASS